MVRQYYDLFAAAWRFCRRWLEKVKETKDGFPEVLDMIEEAREIVDGSGEMKPAAIILFNVCMEIVDLEYQKRGTI